MARYKHDPKRMRAYPQTGLVMPGEHGGDMTVYASRSNYLLKGQCLVYSTQVYRATKRIRNKARDELNMGTRYDFELVYVRDLTKEETRDLYMEKTPPLQLIGENW